MAGKAGKKQAQTNLAVLSRLYQVSLPIVALAILKQFYLGEGFGALLRFALLHVPMIGCIYVLDKSGRPHFDSKGKLLREGSDLSQTGGLTEYLFDLVYLSLFGDFGKILFSTNKLWYVLLLVPVYAGWKLYGLKNQFMQKQQQQQQQQQQAPQPEAEARSKRQQKREKRGDRPHVKYR
ncbi:Snd2p TDEL_0C00480 [Torulaspora delbrueckii]|uniref:DUF788 domain protein n=1 Tax=Torulaspora delbrueckii TaxID=4950 RepID=G8ZQZ5_TORDE|nr:hypothetical protein TDEL_0C00480 [Torulaspora delbrueckii]CCE90937.1 hypothetical protein TDEL_0C00480 [Torulaspora delbrueckii]